MTRLDEQKDESMKAERQDRTSTKTRQAAGRGARTSTTTRLDTQKDET